MLAIWVDEMMFRFGFYTVSLLLAVCLLRQGMAAEKPREESPPAKFRAEQLEFFATQVAPVLHAHCFSCHGGEAKIQGNLRLTSREAIRQGGESGPAVNLDKADESLLLEAINYKSLEMPPKGQLPPEQIDILTRWVKDGLPWSDEAIAAAAKAHGPPQVDAKARNFWSFRPLASPAIPIVKDKSWVRNPVDAFVLAKLETHGARPAPLASKASLLRRAYYAITGLPPTPEEIDAFTADDSPGAYEKIVDKLLESPDYGEHWGRHWLDLVRYAETNSFERDGTKPNAWKYRDYVIRSFNDNKPYDQFIREQLAGDELQPLTRDGVIATGFYRLGSWDDEPADRELAYYEQLDDIISTVGQTFLGLTTGCARCHDHKIDPFPQKDYYRLVAFFHGVNGYNNGDGAQRVMEAGEGAAPGKTGGRLKAIKPFREDLGKLEGQAAEFEQKLARLNEQITAVEKRAERELIAGEKDDFAFPENRPAILEKRVGSVISKAEYGQYRTLLADRNALIQSRPASIETALAVIEQGPLPRDTFILARGIPGNRTDKVEPGFPTVMLSADAADPVIPPAPNDALSSGRRRVLADWIADPANRLTARVMVNRLWQYNFGRGLVRSSSNFGYQGTPPTNPELLDWLASEFVASGWNLKSMQRLMLTSSAFRMASHGDPAIVTKDPENDWLSHFDPRRLSAEELRDSVLAVSGNLHRTKRGGPSVFPVIPAEVLAGQSRPGDGWGQSTPEEAASRSVFVFVKRSLAVPLLAVFDAPDPDAPCPVRFTTTQPSQALGLLNGQFLKQQGGIFAESIRRKGPLDSAAQVREILRRVTQRTPATAEIERGVKFIALMQEQEKLTVEESLARFCLLALNLNEFVYLD